MQLAHDIGANTGMPYREALTYVLNGGPTLQPGTPVMQPHAALGVRAEQGSGARVKPERSAAGLNGLPQSQPGSVRAAGLTGGSCKTESGAYDEEAFDGEAMGVEDEAALQVMHRSSPDMCLGGRVHRRKLGPGTSEPLGTYLQCCIVSTKGCVEGSLGVWSKAQIYSLNLCRVFWRASRWRMRRKLMCRPAR